MTGQGLDLLETRLTAKKMAKPGFDPTVIIAIIQAIIAMISGCPKPTTTRLRLKLGNRAALTMRVHAETGASIKDCFEHADDALDLAKEATDPELQSVIDDCHSS